ncbi:U3 small nucleolar RNA-associated protein 10 [Sordaria brevicollis]|uniref:U3 small nucleolar RNA-associated protein 10 n=1 Tax=Sordaria brevicollis TaxID=83679 RepID=A0AAE0P289_SORBR|nr:U3 small nucleolar RNA-associated protein 10 [Sordaria brevicollis]
MSSLASQLAQIAANSRSTLNTKVLKAAHSKSLIFEPRVAATQTYPEIYSICLEGFEELCNLDSRFTKFAQSLWSEQSQEADRTQMSAAENAALDKHVEAFLHLCGSRLRLMPAIKAIEWLIRRFRVHEFNTAALIATFLPYHTIPAFVTLLSILPANIPKEYRFLDPYIRSLTAPPRAAIVQQATNRPELLTAISQYTLDSCKYQMEYPGLISFWGGVMVEATNGLLDKYRSGRRSIQIENDNALMQQLAPVLSDAMVMKSSPGLQIASYMVVTILAAKGGLADNALTAFMDQLVHGWTPETMRPGLVTLCIISQHRSAKQLSARVTKALLKVPELASVLNEIAKDYRVDKLANGLALALVDRLHKKGDVRSLPVVNSLLLGNVLREKQIKVVYKSLLVAAHRINDQVDQDGAIRKELGTILVSLSQASGEVGDIVRATIEEVDFDIDALELTLGASIRPKLAVEDATEAAVEETTLKVDKEAELAQNFEKLSKLKAQTASCFAEEPLDLLEELYSLFLSVAANEANLQKFDEAPVLSRTQAPTKLFYASFYMRLWCGSLPALAKVAALDHVKNLLKDEEFAKLDFQAVVPYAIVALSDPAKKVRRAAAELVTVLGSFYESKPSKARRVWGSEGLYAKTTSVNWMDFDATKSLIHSVLIPSLEESLLHEDHILAALTNALESSKSKDGDKKHLSHATRLAIFKFLSSHVVGTPLIAVKLRLLQPLNQIKSISGTSRTDLLLPLLQWWARLSEAEAQQLLARESVDEASVNNAFVDVVIANNEAGLKLIFELINDSNVVARNGLVQSLFGRIQKIWSSMKAETQFSTARALLTLSQAVHPTSSEPDVVATEAADALHKVELSTDILLDFLESLYDDIKKATEKPATKRRRVGGSEKSVDTQSPADVSASLNKATFVLELVQESKPAEHPELLPSLFTTLSELQHLRTVVGSELGYLQSLVLSSLLAMIPAYKDSKELTIDPAAGHGDILASCIQRSSSPTVINAALLLVASLARTAPDVVLHSVMPIFTFMGSSVLKQADDYSAHVVNQTVKEVIPPLIETFRKSRRNLVASTAELLTSFVVAYEHIPSHRKQDLFITLIENLGPEDFLFAVLAMFVDKYGATDNMLTFTTQIIGSFSVEIQLQTLIKHLELISDIFKPKPVLSAALLTKIDSNSEQDVQKLALKQLHLLPRLLSNRRLKQEISALAEKDDMESVKIRELYAQLLESVLTLSSNPKTKEKALYKSCGEALTNLLNLLSIAEFIKSVEALLDRPNLTLRQKVLRALEHRVDSESINSPKSREALLAFLPQLTAVIRESDDMNYKHTAVNCVDKIAEKYGKKDLDAVAAAAATIAGESCLGQSSRELRVMALLCLASLVDVLQDAIVPVLPIATPKALDCLGESIKGEKPDGALHNAAYAFMAALAQHIPYMISGAYLDRLLACSNASAAAGLDEECRANRVDCLQFVAKLIDGKVLFTALDKNFNNAAACGYSALEEYLQILGTALDKHPKSSIAKNTALFTGIFLNAFDLRRSGVLKSAQELEKTELLVNETSLKMIYKLNDAAFRPMFSHLMEWSTTGLPKSDTAGKAQRQVSTYGFLQHFFENLKSIVTSYASYIIDSAVKVLFESSSTGDEVLKTLRSRVLRTLNKCFEHDQDGFWQAPAHFNAVAPVLVAQFAHAARADNCTDDLIPAVVELAAAADSKEHHKEINSALLKHLRSEQAAVRLAVIKCQQALTSRLGEEWLQSLPEMLPFISELQDDDDEVVERENRRWIVGIEEALGESLDNMLQ